MEAICSRGDLSESPSTSGCIDTKISDYKMAMEMTSVAESGPTHQVSLIAIRMGDSQTNYLINEVY